MLDLLRTLIRRAGLTAHIAPILSKLENRRLASYGSLLQKRLSDTKAELTYGNGQEKLLIGPPHHFAYMATNRHELPTLVACLNVFAPLLHDKKGIVWDVGANVGFYSVLLGKLIGRQGQVYAFEPVPSTHGALVKNVTEAGCTNISALNLALSDQNGTLPMSFDPESHTTSSLESSALVTGRTISVRVATGDSLVASGECLAPNILKMDIEGHELKALEGMTALLARPECLGVLCEIHFSILASSGVTNATSRVCQIMQKAGFTRITFISRSHLMATKT